jgi:hypothetical protein
VPTFSRLFRGETVAGGLEQNRERRNFVLRDNAFLATPASAKRDHARAATMPETGKEQSSVEPDVVLRDNSAKREGALLPSAAE